MSLTPRQYEQIEAFERQIRDISYPPHPQTAIRFYENKQFNTLKKDMPHLSSKEISGVLYQQWQYLGDQEKAAFKEMELEANRQYLEDLQAACKLKSQYKQQIHDIKYSSDNPAVKASGKLKYMSPYRFFRRDMVPIVKGQNPDFDGKARQLTIRAAWKKVPDNAKFIYVLMSRADKEKAIYFNKLS